MPALTGRSLIYDPARAGVRTVHPFSIAFHDVAAGDVK